MYEEQKRRAEGRLEEILSGGPVNGIRLDIERGHAWEWAEPLNPGWFGIPGGNRKYVVAPATVNIRDFLRLQASTRSGDLDRFLRGAYDETVKRAARSIETGANDVPTPVLEMKADGTLAQEGRSRARGASKAGKRRMPIWVAVQVYK